MNLDNVFGSECHNITLKYKKTRYLGVEVEKISCWNCNAEIVQYYHDGYKGKRGRCPICGVDFPLE